MPRPPPRVHGGEVGGGQVQLNDGLGRCAFVSEWSRESPQQALDVSGSGAVSARYEPLRGCWADLLRGLGKLRADPSTLVLRENRHPLPRTSLACRARSMRTQTRRGGRRRRPRPGDEPTPSRHARPRLVRPPPTAPSPVGHGWSPRTRPRTHRPAPNRQTTAGGGRPPRETTRRSPAAASIDSTQR
jgi:hypothetical protein